MIKYFEDEEFNSTEDILSKIEGAEFVACRFTGLELSETSLRGTKFIECQFDRCNLSNASVTNASFRDVEFNNCKLIGINWSSINTIFDFKAKASLLDYCIFSGVTMAHSTFKECSIKNAEFTESNIKGSTFDYCDLTLSNFHHTNLEEIDLREARNYSIDITCNKMRGARCSIPEAVSLLSPLGIIVT